MATQTGQQISYSATLPQKRVVTDRIIMMDPNDIVAITALGLSDGAQFNFANPPAGPNQPYEWLQDTYLDRTDAVNSGALTSDTTLTNLVVDNGVNFQVGDVLLIDAEYMYVSSISSNTLTVIRDWGGTQATHADNATVTIVGRSRIEGATTSDSPFTEPTSNTNAVSILHKEIDMSRSNRNLQRYGIGDSADREIDKGVDECFQLLNLMAYHGQRKGGSSTAASAMGGFSTFITTHINALSSTPALTQKNIEDEAQDCWDSGGRTDTILCGAWAKRKIADFYSGSVRTERDETMGGMTIDWITTPVGLTMKVLADRHCQTDFLYLLDSRFVGFLEADPLQFMELGKTGDQSVFGQVVGEYSLAVAYEKAHSIVSGFSTSA